MTALKNLFQALSRTRNSLSKVLRSFSGENGSGVSMESLEACLIASDMGLYTADSIMKLVSNSPKNNVLELVSDHLISILDENHSLDHEEEGPTAILIVGVNGTGKTTSAAKLAHFYSTQNQSVLLVAADTYRAAAVDQLRVWAKRIGIRIVCNESSKDPSAVLFDGLSAAGASGENIIIADTAGRLHTYSNLMDELAKMKRVIDNHFPHMVKKSLITIDASLGQNSLQQARSFSEHGELDGAILTKMDGTAKGGIVFPLLKELNLPVRFIGTGEELNDLSPFDPDDYVNSLLGLTDE